MKKGLVICGPDVAYGPLALLSGSFEDKARKAAALGFDGVELMVRDPAGLDWLYIKTTLGALGLEIPQLVTGELFGADGLRLVTPDPYLYQRTLTRLQAVIDLAAYLGAMVNIGRVRGRLEMPESSTNAWEVAVERLRSVARYASAKGVHLTLEPLNRYETDFILNVDDGLRMIHDLHCDNVGLMLDTFHMNIEEQDLDASLAQAGHWLWHLHVADSNRRFPGSGHLPFESLFAALRQMGYRGYISAELLPLPDPDTAAQETMRFLQRMDR